MHDDTQHDDPQHVDSQHGEALDAFDALYLKYEFDGVTTLAGLAEALRVLADELDTRLDSGWELAAPVDGGWAHLRPA